MTPTGYSLFWRPKKRRWILSAPDSFGVWRQKTLPEEFRKKDRKSAEQWVTETLAGRTAPHRAADGPLLSDVADRWTKLRKQGRSTPSTLKDNATHLSLYILPTFKDWPLGKLADDVPALRRWIRDFRSKVSPSRCRNICSTMRTLLDDARGEGWVRFAENPMRSSAVTKELPPLPVMRPVVVSLDDAQALLASDAPLPRRVRYALAFTTGLADGEISGLRWGDVGSATVGDVVGVEQAMRLVGGIGAPKNKFRVRRLPLHQCAIDALTEWRGAVEPLLGHPVELTDPVFPGAKRGGFARPDSAKLIRRDLVVMRMEPVDRAYVDDARITKEERAAARAAAETEFSAVTFHATRRSLLTWLADLEVPREIRKRFAGHARGDVTEEHYTARSIEQLRTAVSKVALRWSSVVSGIVPSSTDGKDNHVNSQGAPGQSRTAGQRFRKTLDTVPKGAQLRNGASRSALERTASNGLRTTNNQRFRRVDVAGHSAGSAAQTANEALDATLSLRGGK